MIDLTHPTGWGGQPDNLDEFSAMILLVVASAGKHITYKQAAKQIDELIKWREMKEDEKKERSG